MKPIISFSIEYREHGRWGPAAGTNISAPDARALWRALPRMCDDAERTPR